MTTQIAVGLLYAIGVVTGLYALAPSRAADDDTTLGLIVIAGACIGLAAGIQAA